MSPDLGLLAISAEKEEDAIVHSSFFFALTCNRCEVEPTMRLPLVLLILLLVEMVEEDQAFEKLKHTMNIIDCSNMVLFYRGRLLVNSMI